MSRALNSQKRTIVCLEAPAKKSRKMSEKLSELIKNYNRIKRQNTSLTAKNESLTRQIHELQNELSQHVCVMHTTRSVSTYETLRKENTDLTEQIRALHKTHAEWRESRQHTTSIKSGKFGHQEKKKRNVDNMP